MNKDTPHITYVFLVIDVAIFFAMMIVFRIFGFDDILQDENGALYLPNLLFFFSIATWCWIPIRTAPYVYHLFGDRERRIDLAEKKPDERCLILQEIISPILLSVLPFWTFYMFSFFHVAIIFGMSEVFGEMIFAAMPSLLLQPFIILTVFQMALRMAERSREYKGEINEMLLCEVKWIYFSVFLTFLIVIGISPIMTFIPFLLIVGFYLVRTWKQMRLLLLRLSCER